MENPRHKTTECQNPTCPHKLDSDVYGMINFPSHCINIGDDDRPLYTCLPCGYKCGAVG